MGAGCQTALLLHPPLSPKPRPAAAACRSAACTNPFSPFRSCSDIVSVTVATAGGEPREIYQPKMPVSVILWSRDGRNLIWSSRQQGAEQKVEILAMPAEGGEPQSYGIAQRNVLVTTISPDGRQIVFQGLYTESVVWIMKLLESKAKSSRQGVLENMRFPISAAEEAITKIEKMTIMSPAFWLMSGVDVGQAAAGAVGILASSSASRCSACHRS